MRLTTVVRRAAVGLALVVGMLVAGSPPAAATHPGVQVSFSADYERDCWYMFTEGTLDFQVAHWPERDRVDVRGLLAERILPKAPCVFNENTFAEFVAYVTYHGGPQVVDNEIVFLREPNDPSDPAVREFTFSLVNNSSLRDFRIDRVDVRVCRDFGPMLPAFSCGDWQTFRPHSTGPVG